MAPPGTFRGPMRTIRPRVPSLSVTGPTTPAPCCFQLFKGLENVLGLEDGFVVDIAVRERESHHFEYARSRADKRPRGAQNQCDPNR